MKRHIFLTVVLSVFTLALITSSASADRTQELQQQFKSRLPDIKQLKADGKIGETSDGVVEAVTGSLDGAAKKLISDENSDRRELYDIIAKKEGTTAQVVAERNAQRNFSRAATGEYLKDKDGHWKKKGS